MLGLRLFSAHCIILLLFSMYQNVRAQSDPNAPWSDLFNLPGTDGAVTAFAELGDKLIVAGNFTRIGRYDIPYIASWDGSVWNPLGAGLNGPAVSLVVYNGDLIASGTFTMAGNAHALNIARWDGTKWSPLGAGISGQASLVVHANTLIAAGNFSMAGGDSVHSIASWNGDRWSEVGGGVTGTVGANGINGLASYNGDLYATGQFEEMGGVAALYIARWDGVTWHPLTTGLDGAGEELIVYDDRLIVGGRFFWAGDAYCNSVAAWDGSGWSVFSTGIPNGFVLVLSFAEFDSQLVLSGYLPQATAVMRWDGSSWSQLGGRLARRESIANVNALREYGGKLYAGGRFDAADDHTVYNICVYDQAEWQPVETGLGVEGTVNALEHYAGDVIAAGLIWRAGDIGVSCIARWDGGAWHRLAEGLSGSVNSLAIYDGSLIAGGFFTMAGGAPANNIATWSGTTWSTLGQGVNQVVQDLIEYGGEVVVVGGFTQAGSVPVDRIARWDGSEWKDLGVDFTNSLGAPLLRTLATFRDQLIVGGQFDTVNGMQAGNIASWNGSDWATLGAGIAGEIEDLAVWNDKLYVVGDFSTVNSWNGSSWLPPFQLSGGAMRIHSFSEGLIVAGPFSSVANVAATRVARFYAGTWNPVGSGVSAAPLALLVAGDGLYLGGTFTRAGNKHSVKFAIWQDVTTAIPETAAPAFGTRLEQPYETPRGGGVQLRYSLSDSRPVALTIFDVRGRRIRALLAATQGPGNFDLTWDRSTDTGGRVSRGVYLVRLESAGVVASRKLILLRGNP